MPVRDDEKRDEDNPGIVIKDDVWIVNSCQYSKQRIYWPRRSSGGWTVVMKSVLPHAIVAGNPAQVLRMRWSSAEIFYHERCITENTHR